MTRGQGEQYEMIPWFMRGKPGDDWKTLVVAEIGNNHEGSWGNLVHMIECAALVGADAVKIQVHCAESESQWRVDGGLEHEPFPDRFQYHPQDDTRLGYWHRMEFDNKAMEAIRDTIKKFNIKLIASVFSVDGLEWLLRFIPDVWAIKIPSGETDNQKLMEAVYAIKKPVIISTGMSDTREVNANVCLFLNEPAVPELYVLQCITEYPTHPVDVGMNVVEVYSRNLLFKGGLSDHSGTIYPSIVAAYLGAAMVEVHVTFHKRMFGADIISSVTFEELEQLVGGVYWANEMRKNPVNKDMFEIPESAKVYRQGRVNR